MPRVKAEPTADTPTRDLDDGGSPPASSKEKGDGAPYSANTTGTRRNANGSVSSVYSGNKIRHLKKEDGVPLWRKDIQYDFLKTVFEDDKRVFHKKSDGTFGHSFADIYLDAMAKSSKCSKILKDKLLTERAQAVNMAMVCLLVNVGRMNTTLNFFPEMRAQLRTYHSIPSLQAHQDPNAYKQLQDAPRLKSILKGATEDVEQPSTVEDIQAAAIPRTNPVNLIFVLSQFAPKISETHFDVPRDFFDLVMKDSLSSATRARAFLWLMWWYLESDFTEKAALDNPYGPGRTSTPEDDAEMPLKCPQFDYLTDEQIELENVDTPEEIEFGEIKRVEREAILKTDMAPVITGPKRTGNKRVTHFILNHLNEPGTPSPLNAGGQPVFSVASEDGASSPTREPGSPGAPPPPPPPRGGVKSKTLSGGTFVNRMSDQHYDTDRTRSASPPTHHTSTFSAKPQSAMRINALLTEESPGPGASPSSAPTSSKPKGPGRGNWRRNREGVNHTPRSFAAKLEQSLDNASQASSVAPGRPDLAGGAGPHGYYLPLNGQEPAHKRSRPLTNHQLLVEKYRKERVDHILDRAWRRTIPLSYKKRQAEGALTRAWKRCKALRSGYDSEEETESRATRLQQAQSGPAAQHLSSFEAADTLLLMAGLQRAHWERSDWGEESIGLARGMRRVQRRLERWETGATVPRTAAGERYKRPPQYVKPSGLGRIRPKIEDDGSDVASNATPPSPIRKRKSAARKPKPKAMAQAVLPASVVASITEQEPSAQTPRDSSPEDDDGPGDVAEGVAEDDVDDDEGEDMILDEDIDSETYEEMEMEDDENLDVMGSGSESGSGSDDEETLDGRGDGDAMQV